MGNSAELHKRKARAVPHPQSELAIHSVDTTRERTLQVFVVETLLAVKELNPDLPPTIIGVGDNWFQIHGCIETTPSLDSYQAQSGSLNERNGFGLPELLKGVQLSLGTEIGSKVAVLDFTESNPLGLSVITQTVQTQYGERGKVNMESGQQVDVFILKPNYVYPDIFFSP